MEAAHTLSSPLPGCSDSGGFRCSFTRELRRAVNFGSKRALAARCVVETPGDWAQMTFEVVLLADSPYRWAVYGRSRGNPDRRRQRLRQDDFCSTSASAAPPGSPVSKRGRNPARKTRGITRMSLRRGNCCAGSKRLSRQADHLQWRRRCHQRRTSRRFGAGKRPDIAWSYISSACRRQTSQCSGRSARRDRWPQYPRTRHPSAVPAWSQAVSCSIQAGGARVVPMV